MEIQACWFFWFWSLTSITFLHLGFKALDKTDLCNSVPPVFMSLLKHSLAISTCCSCSYALVYRLRLKLPVDRRHFWISFGILCVMAKANNTIVDDSTIGEAFLCGPVLSALINFFARLRFLRLLKTLVGRYSIIITTTLLLSALFPWYLHIFTFVNFFPVAGGAYYLNVRGHVSISIHIAIESSLFFVSGEKTMFNPIIVLFISFFGSALWAGLTGFEPFTTVSWESGPADHQKFQDLLDVAAKGKEVLSAFMGTKIGRMIKFGVGMVGTVVFQSLFRLTSFGHVVAFLYLAVAWLANVALLGVLGDFGILNFLIGNVIVGCTVNQFGLHVTTWVAYGASLVLYGLRLVLESVAFVSTEVQEIVQVNLW